MRSLMRYSCFDPFLQFSTRDHHVSPARVAFESDVGAQPDDSPFVSAAWVRLAQPNAVAKRKFERRFGWHAAIIAEGRVI